MTKIILAAATILFALVGYASAAVNPADVENRQPKAGTVAWYLTPSTAITQGNEIGMEPFHNAD